MPLKIKDYKAKMLQSKMGRSEHGVTGDVI
jgi:hypothetical protein